MNLPKFKAKRAYNGEWVYGYIIETEIWLNNGRTPAIDTARRFDDDGLSIDVFEIIPETLCQFTGIIDKDGVEIYSNDIRHDGEHQFRIYEIPGGFAVKAKYWWNNIADLAYDDILIMEPIAEPQLAVWIKESTTAAGNYHDINHK